MSPTHAPQTSDIEAAEAVAHPRPLLEGLGVYVHFPWCLDKCPYCDFLSVKVPTRDGHVASCDEARASLPHVAYADAVIAELEARVADAWREDGPPTVQSLFFGGGTPSLWDPDQVGRVVQAVRSRLTCPHDMEVTLECNPTSVDHEHFSRLLDAGVNRVSIGVQALSEERLRFLGRLHDEPGGLGAVRCAVDAGMPLVSADLIYGVHRQAPEDAVRDVSRIAELGVQHLSAYMLTVEPGTRFGAAHAAGRLPLLDDALVAQSMKAVSRAMTSAGFEHYEVSNFARAEARSMHNWGYWLGRDYLGLGTGAFGTVHLPTGRIRYRNLLSPERYVAHFTSAAASVAPFDKALAERESLTPETSVQEALMLGLRLREGVDLTAIEAHFRAPVLTRERRRAIDRLSAQQRVEWDGTRLRIPQQLWHLADGIIVDLL